MIFYSQVALEPYNLDLVIVRSGHKHTFGFVPFGQWRSIPSSIRRAPSYGSFTSAFSDRSRDRYRKAARARTPVIDVALITFAQLACLAVSLAVELCCE
jgi:hypothetical protein